MPKSNVFQVSQSKVNVWRKCRYAYHLRYVERLRRRAKSRPLQFGTLVHTMVEADANGQNPFKALEKATKEQKLFLSEREELEEIAGDVRNIMTDYYDFWDEQGPKDQLKFITKQGKKAEHEIILDLAPGIQVIMKLDAIAENSRGRFLVDHKTFRQMPSEDHRWRSLQANLYKWGLDELKIKVDGMCWNYIRSKPPTVPQVLKNGKVSEKRLDTLPRVLHSWAKRERLSIPARMLLNAKDNRKTFFIRNFNSFRMPTVKMLMGDFIETAQDMKTNHGTKVAKTIDRHCDWCEFEPICRAEMTGANVKYVKQKEFTTSEQRERQALESAD